MLPATRLIWLIALSVCLFPNSTPAAGSNAGTAASDQPGTSASQSGTVTSNGDSKPNSGAADSKSSANGTFGPGPTQPVITVRGLCKKGGDKANADRSNCATVVSREQFDRLISVLNPPGRPISTKGRQTLAHTYAEALVLEDRARESGIEDSDEFRLLMDWARLQIGTQLYRRRLEERYRTPSKEEIDAFYQQHLASYERAEVLRILAPRVKASSGNPEDDTDFDKKALEAANDARERVAKGEDPKEVQKDVYAKLGLSSPPPVNLGKYGRNGFTDKEGPEVFALKAGEVSQVEVEPKSYVVYKVESRETLSQDEVKPEISQQIFAQKFKDAMKEVTDATPAVFDEQYFGAGVNAVLTPTVAPTPSAH